jgi:hypothetical protein
VGPRGQRGLGTRTHQRPQCRHTAMRRRETPQWPRLLRVGGGSRARQGRSPKDAPEKFSYSLFGSPMYHLSMVAVSDPQCRPRGCRSLRGWAILHKTVTAIGVDIGYALTAAADRTRTSKPLPRLLRHGRPAVRWVDVWIDIGLCICRHHPGGWSQNAHAIAIRARFIAYLPCTITGANEATPA